MPQDICEAAEESVPVQKILYIIIIIVTSAVLESCVCMWSLSSLGQALRQRSASLAEAQRGAQSAQTERAAVEERLRGLQRAVAMLETEKKDAERQAVRLEKDKNALRNTLDKVSTVFITTNVTLVPLSHFFTKDHLCIQSSWAGWTHVGFYQ